MAIVRRIPNAPSTLFVTFDDGPDPNQTPRVLDLLGKLDVKATFFVVGNKAEREPGLCQRIIHEGHRIGNHSPDHRYHHYSRGSKHLQQWIEQGRTQIESVIHQNPVGFRAPAGILTPPLVQAAEDLGTPLIHWSVRFFDRAIPFHRIYWSRKCRTFVDGDIILLHDVQRAAFQSLFLKSLSRFLSDLRDQGWAFRAIEPMRG